MGPVFLLLLLGSACVCGGGGGLNSDSLKREKESCYKNSHCLFKQKAWLLTAGRKSFLAIKEASQFCFTFII